MAIAVSDIVIGESESESEDMVIAESESEDMAIGESESEESR